MRVLLSIKPVHVGNILSGVKTFEFRRKLFARRDVKTVLIYCTMPVGRLVGEFDIAEILQDHPDRLWLKTRSGSGISKEYFDGYFCGRTQAYALKIGEVRPFAKHIDPSDVMENFSPPQSFMYVGTQRSPAFEQPRLF
jgi:predicted transcriptional regulator